MRLPITSLFLVALIGWARPAFAQGAVDTIIRLDSAWARAYATHDTGVAKALFAPRILITGTSGRVKDREAELNDVRPIAGLEMHYFHTRDVRVVLYDPAAVVTGLAEWSFSYQGKPNTMRLRYTATYVRGGELNWQMVALHLGAAPA